MESRAAQSSWPGLTRLICVSLAGEPRVNPGDDAEWVIERERLLL
jgi:hypothetical protein